MRKNAAVRLYPNTPTSPQIRFPRRSSSLPGLPPVLNPAYRGGRPDLIPACDSV